jgi:[amino group carrier protein]-lysine/ornithine hydrolase
MMPSNEVAIDLITQIVAIPSLCGEEDAVAERLSAAMNDLGFRSVRRDSAGNVIGETGAENAEHSIVLLGHMDTVPGAIPVQVRDGSLYGRGSVDAKGPLITAVIAAARAAQRTSTRLIVIGAVQEEGPSIGARNLVSMPAPSMLVICEPGGWEGIVLGYKGSRRFTAEITVPTTHSAAPEPTAAELAYRLWQRVVAWCESYPVPEGKEPEIFHQLTPTLIRTGWNQDGLHETEALYVGLRLPPGVDPEWVKTELPRLAPEAQFTFAPGEAAVRSPRTSPLVSRFTRSIRDQGGRPRYKLKTGTSDMNVVLPVWGCPAVAYGPGDSRLDHTPDEHLRLDEYLRAVRVLTSVLEEV